MYNRNNMNKHELTMFAPSSFILSKYQFRIILIILLLYYNFIVSKKQIYLNIFNINFLTHKLNLKTARFSPNVNVSAKRMQIRSESICI